MGSLLPRRGHTVRVPRPAHPLRKAGAYGRAPGRRSRAALARASRQARHEQVPQVVTDRQVEPDSCRYASLVHAEGHAVAQQPRRLLVSLAQDQRGIHCSRYRTAAASRLIPRSGRHREERVRLRKTLALYADGTRGCEAGVRPADAGFRPTGWATATRASGRLLARTIASGSRALDD
jgi:hypothetical protein